MHTAPSAGTAGRAGTAGLRVGGSLAWTALLALAWLAGTALQMLQATLPSGPQAWAGLTAAAFGFVVGVGGLRAWRLWQRSLACAGTDGGHAAGLLHAHALSARLLRSHLLHSRLLPAVLAGLTCLGAFGLGWFHADLRAQARLQQALALELEGQDLVLTGTVAELPRLSAVGVRFVFEVETAEWLDKRPGSAMAPRPVNVPQRVSLAWFQGWDVDTVLSRPAMPLVAGDRWRLPVRLKRPHGAVNPHGFDLERWLFEQDLRATGHVRPGAQRLQPAAAHPLERLRQHWRDAILLHVADPAAAGVLAALAVGDQAAIDS
ncbi:MAG: ComEC/Rec2 family competence protein, partial [Rubrivivax sp.]